MDHQEKLNVALGEVFKHLRDVSLRDGIQSWDGNRWKIDDVLTVTEQMNALAVKIHEELGVTLPPVEAWGGGQVNQPAKFQFEDPFVNLERIRKAGPNLKLQCLYRGRQCFGYKPVSEAIQQEAIGAAAERGIEVFRVFDMMNDISNLMPGINAVKKQQETNPNIVLEGAISYISEPTSDPAKRAWTLPEYGVYAVELAQHGCDEIAIKNYAGVGGGEMVPLIQQIRKSLDEAGFKGKKINLHMHGDKSKTLCDAIAAGADKVDVAIGDLSGGPSHSNMRDVIHEQLARQRLTKQEIDEIDSRGVMQQLAQVEKTINAIVTRKDLKPKTPGELQSFDDQRGVLKKLTGADIEKYRMAAGSFSDLWATVSQNYDSMLPQWKGRKDIQQDYPVVPIPLDDPKDMPGGKTGKEKYFRLVLEEAPALWERAGRINTVTPGAKILTYQALNIVNAKLQNKPITIREYTPEYMGLISGHYGSNQGMEKGIGNVRWRDTAMILRALDQYNKQFDLVQKTLTPEQIVKLKVERNKMGTIVASGLPDLPLTAKASGKFEFSNKVEELSIRPQQDTTSVLRLFRNAVQGAELPAQIKTAMLAELQLGRSPTPTAGLEAGEKIIGELQSFGIDVEAMRNEGKPVSDPKTLSLLAVLLQDKNTNGTLNNDTIRNLLGYHAGVKLYTATVPPPVDPVTSILEQREKGTGTQGK